MPSGSIVGHITILLIKQRYSKCPYISESIFRKFSVLTFCFHLKRKLWFTPNCEFNPEQDPLAQISFPMVAVVLFGYDDDFYHSTELGTPSQKVYQKDLKFNHEGFLVSWT